MLPTMLSMKGVMIDCGEPLRGNRRQLLDHEVLEVGHRGLALLGPRQEIRKALLEVRRQPVGKACAGLVQIADQAFDLGAPFGDGRCCLWPGRIGYLFQLRDQIGDAVGGLILGRSDGLGALGRAHQAKAHLLVDGRNLVLERLQRILGRFDQGVEAVGVDLGGTTATAAAAAFGAFLAIDAVRTGCALARMLPFATAIQARPVGLRVYAAPQHAAAAAPPRHPTALLQATMHH